MKIATKLARKLRESAKKIHNFIIRPAEKTPAHFSRNAIETKYNCIFVSDKLIQPVPAPALSIVAYETDSFSDAATRCETYLDHDTGVAPAKCEPEPIAIPQPEVQSPDTGLCCDFYLNLETTIPRTKHEAELAAVVQLDGPQSDAKPCCDIYFEPEPIGIVQTDIQTTVLGIQNDIHTDLVTNFTERAAQVIAVPQLGVQEINTGSCYDFYLGPGPQVKLELNPFAFNRPQVRYPIADLRCRFYIGPETLYNKHEKAPVAVARLNSYDFYLDRDIPNESETKPYHSLNFFGMHSCCYATYVKFEELYRIQHAATYMLSDHLLESPQPAIDKLSFMQGLIIYNRVWGVKEPFYMQNVHVRTLQYQLPKKFMNYTYSLHMPCDIQNLPELNLRRKKAHIPGLISVKGGNVLALRTLGVPNNLANKTASHTKEV
ncbi:MAG: hypothetical protein MMC33_010222 [Icmadophila ericetorum]|nr:hypothetical protein [Icmadophila ericetorum]